MFTWIKTIFGAPRAVDAIATVVETGVSMVDKAFYTDQEKAENQTKFIEIWLKLQMILANDNSISAYTRRVIAIIVFANFFLIFFAIAGIWIFNKEWAEFLYKLAMAFQIVWIALTITVFFFGFYGFGKYVSKDNMPFSTSAIDGNVTEKKE